MKETHGVAFVHNNNMGCATSVRATDLDKTVRLYIGASWADLSPEEARFVGRCLLGAANRVEKKVK